MRQVEAVIKMLDPSYSLRAISVKRGSDVRACGPQLSGFRAISVDVIISAKAMR
jgi:hypothetical protein